LSSFVLKYKEKGKSQAIELSRQTQSSQHITILQPSSQTLLAIHRNRLSSSTHSTRAHLSTGQSWAKGLIVELWTFNWNIWEYQNTCKQTTEDTPEAQATLKDLKNQVRREFQ